MVVSFTDIELHLDSIYSNKETLTKYLYVLNLLRNSFATKYRTINFLYRTDLIIAFLKSEYPGSSTQETIIGYIMGILKHTTKIVSKSNKNKSHAAYVKYYEYLKEQQ